MASSSSSSSSSIVPESQSQESLAHSFDEHQMKSLMFESSIEDNSMTSDLARFGQSGKRLFELLSYPCEHEIRIVGGRDSSIDSKVREIIGDITGLSASELKTSVKEKGKWVSVGVTAPVSSSEMLYDCYSRLHGEKAFLYVI